MMRHAILVLTCLLLEGLNSGRLIAQDVPKVRQPEQVPSASADAKGETLCVLLAPPNEIYVWKKGTSIPRDPLQIPGKDIRILKAIHAPGGRGVVILAREIVNLLDWSSQVLLLDPASGNLRCIFDSCQDRWGGAGLLNDAVKRAKVKVSGLADDDLTDIFFCADGRLYFTTEDPLTYRTTIEDGRVARLDVVSEVSLVPSVKVEKQKVGDKEGFLLEVNGGTPVETSPTVQEGNK